MSVSLLGPLILIVALVCGVMGIVLITLGIRGRAEFSSPRCAKCNYDLRAANYMNGAPTQCPECGVDLTGPKAVLFGKAVRRPRLIVFGVVLLALIFVLPALLIATQRSRMGGPAANASRSNAQLLAALPAGITQPWEWQELEKRLTAGTLSNAEVDQAITALTTHLKAATRNEPLSWSRGFLQAAMQANAISPEVFKAFIEAYHNREKRFVSLPTRARQGESIPLRNEHMTNWESQLFRPVWHLREVRAAGKPLPLLARNRPAIPDDVSGSDRSGFRDQISIGGSLPPGEHELELIYDAGAVPPQAIFRGVNGLPGPKAKWPDPIATWERTERHKIRIYGKDEQMVAPVTDPGRAPFTPEATIINHLVVRANERNGTLIISFNQAARPATNITARVVLRTGDLEQDVMNLIWTPNLSRGNMEGNLKTKLPPEITRGDILFIPEPKIGELNYQEVEDYWAKPIEIKDLTIERFDVE